MSAPSLSVLEAPASHQARGKWSAWQPLLSAISKTGGGSVVSGLFAAAAVKCVALAAGPAGIAQLASLQQIRQAALVIATGNGQTALVQGASSMNAGMRRTYLWTCAAIFFVLSCLVALALLIFPGFVLTWAGLASSMAGLIRWMIVPVTLSAMFVYISALLAAKAEMGGLALAQTAAAGAMALGMWGLSSSLKQGHSGALVGALALSGAAGVAMAALSLTRGQRQGSASGRRAPAEFAPWAVRHFFSISGSMLLTSLAGTVAVLAVRAQITGRQGLEVTGAFDAAWAISMGHVSLVLSSLQTYCLPLLARCRSSAEIAERLSRILTVASLLAAGAIVLIAICKPYLLPLFYAKEFSAASQYLRWTLIGDYLKVTSWVLSVPILAAARMRVFLLADLIAYGTFAGAATLLPGIFPGWSTAESAAIAFVLMYAAHLMFCGVYLYHAHAVAPAAWSGGAFLGGLVLVGLASAWTWRAA
jgi:O-antigen/teichoic acid export membrane protein